MLNATADIRDSLNGTLAEIKLMESNTSARIDCAFAMSTRDDYMRAMLRGANLSSCAGLSIPGVFLLFSMTLHIQSDVLLKGFC